MISKENFTFNAPLNNLSFGQVSVALLREAYLRGLSVNIFAMGNTDISTQPSNEGFNKWLISSLQKANYTHNRKTTPALKLWHINGGTESTSAAYSSLLTFHETSEITPAEANILRGLDQVFVTSSYTANVFREQGVQNVLCVPLGFDSVNFRTIDRTRLKIDDTISFLLTGKAEKRKATYKQLNLWAKKYGNDKRFRLNCSITNSHIKPEDQNALIHHALEGKTYWNINFIQYSKTNEEYNAVLQSSDIILGCSGGEGFNLPLYHAVALGSWPVALNAHVHCDYLNSSNAVLVNPNKMVPAYDNIFFMEGYDFNQGLFFDFDENEFLSACDQAIANVQKFGVNTEGFKLQNRTYKQVFSELYNNLFV